MRAAGERGGAAAPSPDGGPYIPGPSRRKPRRFLAGAGTAAATRGAGATPGAGGLKGQSRPHPTLAPAAASASPAKAHPVFQLTLRGWTAPLLTPEPGSISWFRPRGAWDSLESPNIHSWDSSCPFSFEGRWAGSGLPSERPGDEGAQGASQRRSICGRGLGLPWAVGEGSCSWAQGSQFPWEHPVMSVRLPEPGRRREPALQSPSKA